MDLLIKGNQKMGEKVWMFNLPPVKTCTPTKWCLHGKNNKPACYALRNRFNWKNGIIGREIRYELSKQNDFVDGMIKSLSKKPQKFIRVHSSGDFYSKEYVQKWIDITKTSPKKLFRTTTRRRDLTKIIQKLNSLPNFIVRESLDTERQTQKMNLPFAALSSLPIVQEQDSYNCINDCTSCGHYCWENNVNMHFDEH